MTTGTINARLQAEDIKRQAAGRWVQILQSVCRLTDRQLNPRIHNPCPQCGGDDRFRALDDVAETGGLYCNQCFSERNGDGFAAIQWLNGCTFAGALKLVSEFLGNHSSQGNGQHKTKLKEPAKPKPVHATSEKAADAFAYGLTQSGILPKKRKPDAGWRYRHANGTDAFSVVRWNLPDGTKTFGQITKVDGGWICGGMPEPRPLYRLPEIIDAAEVWICEGEKAVDSAVLLGLQATTSAGGSGAAEKSNWQPLNGKCVYILPDNDEPGDKFTRAVVELIRKQAPNATVEVKRLKEDWPELPTGGDVFDWQEQFGSADTQTLRARLQALPDRSGEYVPPKSAPAVAVVVRSFAGIDASELASYATQEPDWLVQDVFTIDEPLLVGARSKGCKTLLLTDLMVAVASGTPWMNVFKVPKRRKVLFITGEANYRRIAMHIQKACNVRDLDFYDLKGFLRIEAIEFPCLPRLADQDGIRRDIETHGTELVTADPLYRGLVGIDSSRLSEMGDGIKSFQAAVAPACLVLSHHVVKSAAREYGSPPQLEDMTGAGIAESCGQWWLIGRNEKYAWDWKHDLCVQFGGREGQGGGRRILFNEQDWTFQVDGWHEFTSEADQERQRQRDDAKRDAEERKLVQARTKILQACRSIKTPQSRSRIRDSSGQSGIGFGTAFADMLRDQTLIQRPYRDGAHRIQTEGFILREYIGEYDSIWKSTEITDDRGC